MTRLIALALGTALVGTPAFAVAQTTQAAAPTAGATVYDTSGGEVGRIESVTAAGAVIDTGTNKVTIPLASLGTGAKGPVLALTKAELDAAAAKAKADASATLQSQLTAGAQVYGQSGASVVGTVKSADPSFVTLTTPKGDVRLPASALGASQGKIIIGMSAADFDAAVSGATASTATTGETTAAPAPAGEEAPGEAPGEPATQN